jgi:hypothetical protein
MAASFDGEADAVRQLLAERLGTPTRRDEREARTARVLTHMALHAIRRLPPGERRPAYRRLLQTLRVHAQSPAELHGRVADLLRGDDAEPA